jgi:hypothetical protein
MQFFKNAFRLSTAFALAAVLGCTSSPTEPSGGGTVPPQPPPSGLTFNVTVTANPSEIVAGGNGSSTITVDVHRADSGQPPPDSTLVTLTTTLGGFGAVGGPQSVQLQLLNGRAQAVLFAGPETGIATVRAVVSDSSGAANVSIGQAATFFISSVDPNVGDPQGGEQVAILGGGFAQPVRVTFSGAAATVRSFSANRIVVTTPSAAAAGVSVGVGETQSVNVQVTIHLNEANQASDTLNNGFTYALGGGTQQPQVFSVDPPSGTNDGGTRVTITGSGFQNPVQVLFGLGTSADTFDGVSATVVSVNPTQIVAISPAARGFGQNLTNQVVDILVKNVNTGFSTVARQQFKYGVKVLITAMGPGSGPYTGGTRVTIHGQGFDDPVAVSLGGVGQAVINTTGTEIIFVTSGIILDQCPANGVVSVTGVRVVNIETGDSGDANLGFDYIVPLPRIFGISPPGGNSGSTATITGQNFSPNVQVTFGDPGAGSNATVGAHSTTSITVTVPNAPQGFTFDTVPCGVNGTMNVPTALDVTVQNLENGCSTTFHSGFALNPSDATCHETASQAPVAAFDSSVLDAATHTMQLIDMSTGSPTTWLWDFGDGSPTSSQQNPQHAYAAAGNYSVTLMVSNAGGSSQAVKVVAVP